VACELTTDPVTGQEVTRYLTQAELDALTSSSDESDEEGSAGEEGGSSSDDGGSAEEG